MDVAEPGGVVLTEIVMLASGCSLVKSFIIGVYKAIQQLLV